MTNTVTATRAGLFRGARLSLPFCASSIIYGVAFGFLATGAGLSTLEALLLSALVFSGSAQVVVLQAWQEHPALWTTFVTVLVANVRYVLMGAALRSWLAPLPAWKSALILLPLVDGSFALAFRQRSLGDHDAGVLVGSCLVSYFGWVVGTAFGTAAGLFLSNPKAIGLDFIIVAFCAASATLLLRRRSDLWPATAAVVAVFACEKLTPGPWTAVVAGAAAAAVSALRYRPVLPPTGASSSEPTP